MAARRTKKRRSKASGGAKGRTIKQLKVFEAKKKVASKSLHKKLKTLGSKLNPIEREALAKLLGSPGKVVKAFTGGAKMSAFLKPMQIHAFLKPMQVHIAATRKKSKKR